MNEQNISSRLADISIDEIWKPIQIAKPLRYPYEISSTGKVRNSETGRLLIPNDTGDKYFQVGIYLNELNKKGDYKKSAFTIHRLVAIHFIDNPEKYPTVDHIDQNTYNNHVNNLRWATYEMQAKNKKDTNRKDQNLRPIHQYDRHENYIKTYYNSLDIEKEFGCERRSLSNACRGRVKTLCGYIWKYADLDDLDDEIWRSMMLPNGQNYNELLISNKGRIKNNNDPFARPTYGSKVNRGGASYYDKDYLKIGDKPRCHQAVHRLVLATFTPVPNMESLEVIHKDGDGFNNDLENLEWVTSTERAIKVHSQFSEEERKEKFGTGNRGQPIIAIHESGNQVTYTSRSKCSKDLNIPNTKLKKIIDTNTSFNGYLFKSG